MTIGGCGSWADEVDWDAELPSPKKEWVNLLKRTKSDNDYMHNYYDSLLRAYSEPQRYYHTIEHIISCLEEFNYAPYLSEHPNEVEFAIWFHDIIYDPKAKDNEEKSLDLAIKVLRNHAELPDFFTTKVSQLILATKHDKIPKDIDSQIICDIDLSILGQPYKKFFKYEEDIRKEYSFVSEEDFRKGRSAILETFLRRKNIYFTEFFWAKYEIKARENLQRSLSNLRS